MLQCRVIGEVRERVCGQEERKAVEWSIPNFSSLQYGRCDCYYSPEFTLLGGGWRLKLWPNTYDEDHRPESGRLVLGLGKCSGGYLTLFRFSLGLRGPGGVVKRVELEIDADGFSPFLTICPRSEVLDPGSGLLPDGVLTVSCVVGRPGGAALCHPPALPAAVPSMTSEESNKKGAAPAATASTGFTLRIPTSSTGTGFSYGAPATSSGTPAISSVQQPKSGFTFGAQATTTTGFRFRQPATTTVSSGFRSGNAAPTTTYGPCAVATPALSHPQLMTAAVSAMEETKKRGVKELLESLQELLASGEGSDCVFEVGPKRLPAHRLILQARSPVFRAMFNHETAEKESGVVKIKDSDPESFQAFLEHLYTGGTGMISAKNVFSLYTSSDKYDLKTLKEACLEFIKSSITPSCFCEAITLSLKHDEKELLDLATEFFCSNALEIVKTVEWRIFLGENSTVANELLIKAFSK